MADALTFALGYRKLGFSVIPIRPRDKRPLMEWAEFQHRVATPDEIRAWYTKEPQAGVGIVGGAVSGDLLILDVDPRHGGMETLQAAGILPDTPTVKTGSGGLHYYFRGAGKSRPLGGGLDCKAAGGYVVAPPSLHPDTGQPYVWLPDCSPRLLERAPAPAWILPRTGVSVPTNPDKWIVAALQGVVEGNRDNACIRLAGYLKSKRLPPDVTLAIMLAWGARCNPVFEAAMVEKTVESAYKYAGPSDWSVPLE